MPTIETKRLLLRPFVAADWPAVLDLAIDWARAPGPVFDKLPTTAPACQQLTDYLATADRYFAIYHRAEDKVIGLLALNGMDDQQRFDLGHIIHATWQDNDLDREAIAAMIDFIFQAKAVSAIVTHNADFAPQLAPLRSLGFQPGDAETGELILQRVAWEQQY